MIRQKARDGMTIFITTHILALAEDIADRIGIIDQGRLVAQGTVAELLRAGGGTDLEDAFLKLTAAPADEERDGDGIGTG